MACSCSQDHQSKPEPWFTKPRTTCSTCRRHEMSSIPHPASIEPAATAGSQMSCTGRQLSVDNNQRHRGSDAGDAPLLLEPEAGAGEGDVVIGGEQGDQAEDQPSDGLGETAPVETPEGPPCMPPVCWRRRFSAVACWCLARWRVDWRRGRGHKPMPRPCPPVPPSGPAVSGTCIRDRLRFSRGRQRRSQRFSIPAADQSLPAP